MKHLSELCAVLGTGEGAVMKGMVCVWCIFLQGDESDVRVNKHIPGSASKVSCSESNNVL